MKEHTLLSDRSGRKTAMEPSKKGRWIALGLVLAVQVAGMAMLVSGTKRNQAHSTPPEDDEDTMRYLHENYDDIDGIYYRKGLKPEDMEKIMYGPMIDTDIQFIDWSKIDWSKVDSIPVEEGHNE